MTDADLAYTRDRFHLTGKSMGQLRTANKRQKRAILAAQARKAPVESTPAVDAKVSG